VRKLLAIILTAVFMTSGVAGIALADEKAKMDKPAEHKAGKVKNANGSVKMSAADSLVVAGKGGTEWTFAVDEKTMIKKSGKSITAADIKPGDSVHVRYAEHEGKNVAERVTVRSGGMAKKNPCAAKMK
jgi:hypothetical protein